MGLGDHGDGRSETAPDDVPDDGTDHEPGSVGPDQGGAPRSPATAASPAATARRRRWSPARIVLATGVAVLVLVPVVLVLLRPSGVPEPFELVENRTTRPENPAVWVELSVESLDAPRGLVRVRMSAVPTRSVPPTGLVVVADVPALQSLVVTPRTFEATTAAEVRVADAATWAYPFDAYDVTIAVAAYERNENGDVLGAAPPGTLDMEGLVVLPDFHLTGAIVDGRDAPPDVDDEGYLPAGAKLLTLSATRNTATILWVLLMMAIYWSMAILAVSTALAVVLGQRRFIWPQMGWMGAMMFAMVAFRNAAPGSPPIGVWFDYAAFFPAEALVALAILGLGGYYLAAERDTLAL